MKKCLLTKNITHTHAHFGLLNLRIKIFNVGLHEDIIFELVCDRNVPILSC